MQRAISGSALVIILVYLDGARRLEPDVAQFERDILHGHVDSRPERDIP